MPMSTIVQQLCQEHLIFNKAIKLFEAKFCKYILNKKVQTLKDNNTWDLAFLPLKAKVIEGKWLSKLKFNNHRAICRYKVRLGAKGFE